MPLLGFDRQCRNRACFEPAQRNWLAGFLAVAIGAIVNARERLIDLGDQLALAIARPQFDCAVGFGGSAVGKIGMILVFFLKVLQRFLGFLENVFAPREQFCAKIFALALIHERLFVGRPIVFGFGQHSHVLPCFFFLG